MSPIRMSRIESASRVVLAFNDAFNHHDVEGIMKLIGDDCVIENYEPAPDGVIYSGKKKITEFWKDFFHKYPQAHNDIEEILGFGMRCISRWKFTWTDNSGEKHHLRGAVSIQSQKRRNMRKAIIR